MNELDKTGKNYYWYWKVKTPFDKLIDACGKCYSLSKNLTMDKVTVLFNRRVIVQ
jgi:hypothetical protein